jgi:hypothetical protein
MRQLAVRQARPRQGLEGLTNLQALVDLQALDLRGATVTNSIMQQLAALTALTQVRRPGSEAHFWLHSAMLADAWVRLACAIGRGSHWCLPLALFCPVPPRSCACRGPRW